MNGGFWWKVVETFKNIKRQWLKKKKIKKWIGFSKHSLGEEAVKLFRRIKIKLKTIIVLKMLKEIYSSKLEMKIKLFLLNLLCNCIVNKMKLYKMLEKTDRISISILQKRIMKLKLITFRKDNMKHSIKKRLSMNNMKSKYLMRTAKFKSTNKYN